MRYVDFRPSKIAGAGSLRVRRRAGGGRAVWDGLWNRGVCGGLCFGGGSLARVELGDWMSEKGKIGGVGEVLHIEGG